MSDFNMHDDPHRRFNPLTGEWVLVSPHRTKRPWQGQVEDAQHERRPAHDPGCYLCPGNARAGGVRNPDYTGTYVFDNDFSALLPGEPATMTLHDDLLVAERESGLCRVICFSPRHDLTLPQMPLEAIRGVVDVWAAQTEELGARDDIGHVQIFENKGAVMGCSNPHPHGQIWAQRTLPNETARELANMRAYHAKHGRSLLQDYVALELEQNARIVCANDGFVALVPFWATWPYETLVLPRMPVSQLPALDEAARADLADVLRRLTIRYDNLFKTSFPYSAGIHQAPTDGGDYPEFDLHMHFYPPLLRSATVKKFMVGYEMLATPQRDITPEASAEALRALPEVHFNA